MLLFLVNKDRLSLQKENGSLTDKIQELESQQPTVPAETDPTMTTLPDATDEPVPEESQGPEEDDPAQQDVFSAEKCLVITQLEGATASCDFLLGQLDDGCELNCTYSASKGTSALRMDFEKVAKQEDVQGDSQRTVSLALSRGGFFNDDLTCSVKFQGCEPSQYRWEMEIDGKWQSVAADGNKNEILIEEDIVNTATAIRCVIHLDPCGGGNWLICAYLPIP